MSQPAETRSGTALTDRAQTATARTVPLDDLIAAWSVLENLTVSLDQIGGTFGEPGKGMSGQSRTAMLEALGAYLSPRLVEAISNARTCLSRYISEEDAEHAAEQIEYWDYSTLAASGTGTALDPEVKSQGT